MVKLVDRTPAHLRCSMGACPSVYELEEVTPEHLKCGPIASTCPAVYEACPAGDCPSVYVHGGQFVIIGKKPPPEIWAELCHKVGEDEDIIVIGKEYFMNVKAGGEDGGLVAEGGEGTGIIPGKGDGVKGGTGG